MKRYSVIVTVDASVYIEVDAENEDQAKEIAMEKVSSPCLCHQCSREVDIGDILEAVEATEIGAGNDD